MTFFLVNDGRLTFKMGVISNFDHRLDVLLRNMKVNHFFDFVLNSYDAGCEKPDKEIFERAIKEAEMEDLNPNECLHIGDTPITDYIGARAAGWHGALIHEKDPKLLKLKYGDKIDDHHVFGSLFDFHKKVSNDYVHWWCSYVYEKKNWSAVYVVGSKQIKWVVFLLILLFPVCLGVGNLINWLTFRRWSGYIWAFIIMQLHKFIFYVNVA